MLIYLGKYDRSISKNNLTFAQRRNKFTGKKKNAKTKE
jgi:hypothetical protein